MRGLSLLSPVGPGTLDRSGGGKSGVPVGSEAGSVISATLVIPGNDTMTRRTLLAAAPTFRPLCPVRPPSW
jgi:hypothetical protein